ncbi:MAG TPA: class I tRNA ligase family protein, partial [Ornithinicoccus sp.]|nr:class I tRNA ligase family protein [Ornithinicoccus sp.]
PGVDTVDDASQMKVGRRLAIKILNASKFALGMGAHDLPEGAQHEAEDVATLVGRVSEPLDRAMLAGLVQVIDTATRAYEGYDYSKALDVTESFFWTFCDDYLELVKERAYGSDASLDRAAVESARAALQVALDVLLRLLAPVVCFATEEVWSWWHTDSVHVQPWPSVDEIAAGAQDADPRMLDIVGQALAGVRRAKSEAKVGMRTEVSATAMNGPDADLAFVRQAETDLRSAGKVVGDIAYASGEVFSVSGTTLVEASAV